MCFLTHLYLNSINWQLVFQAKSMYVWFMLRVPFPIELFTFYVRGNYKFNTVQYTLQDNYAEQLIF